MNRNRQIRNLIIFIIGVYALASAGGVINVLLPPEVGDAGSLLFILSPILMVLVVRVVLRGGWKNAGLRLNFQQGRAWYAFALLAYPLSFLIVILAGVLLGVTTPTTPIAELLPLLLGGIAVQLIPRMLYALSEEWAWRGYLEPELADLGVPSLRRYLMVGLIWGVWHFPLFLSTDYTDVPLAIYLPLFMVGVVIVAFVYGPMRQRSGSVWPAVITHGVANTVAFAILGQNAFTFHNELIAGMTPASLIMMVLWAAAAFLVNRAAQPTPQAGQVRTV